MIDQNKSKINKEIIEVLIFSKVWGFQLATLLLA